MAEDENQLAHEFIKFCEGDAACDVIATRIQEEEITKRALISLDSDDIKELFPTIGVRAVFKRKLAAFNAVNKVKVVIKETPNIKIVNVDAFEQDSSTSNEYVAEPVVCVAVIGDSFTETDLNVSGKTSVEFDETSDTIWSGDDLIFVDTEQQRVGKSNGLKKSSCTSDAGTSASTTTSKTSSTPSTTTARSNVPRKIIDISNLDLEKLLSSSDTGRFVLAYHKKFNSLDKSARARLVEVTVASLIESSGGTILNADLCALSHKIEILFPSEQREVYYVAPKTEGPSQKIAKGKLVDRYRNVLRGLRKVGVVIATRPRKATKSSPAAAEAPDCNTQNFDEHIEWLKHNNEPWSEVIEHWDATIPFRVAKLRSAGGSNVNDFFVEWPVIKGSLGYTLIARDFKHLYPGKELSIYSNWRPFSDKVVPILLSDTKDKFVRESLLIHLTAQLNEEAKDVIVLMSLVGICSPKSRIPTKNLHCKQWKPSIVESLEGFVLHVKVPGDLKVALARRQAKFLAMKLPVQPFIVVVGAPLTSSLNLKYYVAVNDDTIYHVDSILKAVDICYKTFHALHAEYPKESQQLWVLIQKGIYGMSTQWDPKLSEVATLLRRIQDTA